MEFADQDPWWLAQNSDNAHSHQHSIQSPANTNANTQGMLREDNEVEIVIEESITSTDSETRKDALLEQLAAAVAESASTPLMNGVGLTPQESSNGASMKTSHSHPIK